MSGDSTFPDAPLEVLCPETVSSRPLPENFDVRDHVLFAHERARVISPSHLVALSDVNVSPRGVLFRRGRVLRVGFAHDWEYAEWRHWKRRAKLLVAGCLERARDSLQEEAYWITDTQSGEFFHWMGDALPRLLAVKDRLPGSTLLLPLAFAEKPYVRETLAAFPIGNIRYVDRVIRCRKLKVPTAPGSSGNFNPGLMQALREVLRRHFGQFDPPFEAERVYISRARAPRRRIQNEQEAVRVFARYAFTPVCFEQHPFRDQMAIAMQARLLVSNHGAGLSNMLLLEPGASVLEFRKQGDTHDNCYYSLAADLGLPYYYQLCRSVVEDEDVFSADLIVDPEKLARNLELMLAPRDGKVSR